MCHTREVLGDQGASTPNQAPPSQALGNTGLSRNSHTRKRSRRTLFEPGLITGTWPRVVHECEKSVSAVLEEVKTATYTRPISVYLLEESAIRYPLFHKGIETNSKTTVISEKMERGVRVLVGPPPLHVNDIPEPSEVLLRLLT